MTDKEQNPFNEKVDCVKCGNAWCSVVYQPYAFRCEGIISRDVNGIGQINYNEGLLKTCTRCGYQWKEKCLDS